MWCWISAQTEKHMYHTQHFYHLVALCRWHLDPARTACWLHVGSTPIGHWNPWDACQSPLQREISSCVNFLWTWTWTDSWHVLKLRDCWAMPLPSELGFEKTFRWFPRTSLNDQHEKLSVDLISFLETLDRKPIKAARHVLGKWYVEMLLLLLA